MLTSIVTFFMAMKAGFFYDWRGNPGRSINLIRRCLSMTASALAAIGLTSCGVAPPDPKTVADTNVANRLPPSAAAKPVALRVLQAAETFPRTPQIEAAELGFSNVQILVANEIIWTSTRPIPEFGELKYSYSLGAHGNQVTMKIEFPRGVQRHFDGCVTRDHLLAALTSAWQLEEVFPWPAHALPRKSHLAYTRKAARADLRLTFEPPANTDNLAQCMQSITLVASANNLLIDPLKLLGSEPERVDVPALMRHAHLLIGDSAEELAAKGFTVLPFEKGSPTLAARGFSRHGYLALTTFTPVFGRSSASITLSGYGLPAVSCLSQATLSELLGNQWSPVRRANHSAPENGANVAEFSRASDAQRYLLRATSIRRPRDLAQCVERVELFRN